MKKHYNELDSFRGLAALTVLIGHFLMLYPFIEPDTYGNQKYDTLNIFKYSSLHLFWAGHEAVIFFFLLSGFVLSLSYYKSEFKFSSKFYKNYLVRRIFRIYIPYLVAVFVGCLLIVLINPKLIPGASDFISRIWADDFSIGMLLGHFFLIGDFETVSINPVIWSLVHEMRISIIFPFIMLLIIKIGDIKSLVLAFSLSFVSYFVIWYMNVESNYLFTVYYIGIFMVGALLAKNFDYLINLMKNIRGSNQLIIFIFAIILYTFKWLWFDLDFIHILIIDDWAVVIGASLFILLGCSTKSFKAILNTDVIKYLGKISYSLYLYHMLALLTVVHIYQNYNNKVTIMIISLVISVFVSHLSYKYIELNSIKLGRYFTRK